MFTVRGKIQNGTILPLEPIGDNHEGQEVIITFVEDEKRAWDLLFEAIEENQIESELTDLAAQHDHYLYGTPKRD